MSSQTRDVSTSSWNDGQELFRRLTFGVRQRRVIETQIAGSWGSHRCGDPPYGGHRHVDQRIFQIGLDRRVRLPTAIVPALVGRNLSDASSLLGIDYEDRDAGPRVV